VYERRTLDQVNRFQIGNEQIEPRRNPNRSTADRENATKNRTHDLRIASLGCDHCAMNRTLMNLGPDRIEPRTHPWAWLRAVEETSVGLVLAGLGRRGRLRLPNRPWLWAPHAGPLDGNELCLGRARAPARGPAAAPPSLSLRPPRDMESWEAALTCGEEERGKGMFGLGPRRP
jgi:hypothetical protein